MSDSDWPGVGGHHQVLPHREVREDALALGDGRDAAAGQLVGPHARDVAAGDLDRARGRDHQAAGDLERRRLAGAVRARAAPPPMPAESRGRHRGAPRSSRRRRGRCGARATARPRRGAGAAYGVPIESVMAGPPRRAPRSDGHRPPACRCVAPHRSWCRLPRRRGRPSAPPRRSGCRSGGPWAMISTEVEHRQVGADPHHQRHVVLHQQDPEARHGPVRSAGCRTPRSRSRRGPKRARRAAGRIGRAARARPSSTSRAWPVGSAPTGWSATAQRARRSRISSTSSDGLRAPHAWARNCGRTAVPTRPPAADLETDQDVLPDAEGREHLEALERPADAAAGALDGCPSPRCPIGQERTDPGVGGVTPHTALNIVVLPAPLGPISPVTCPASTARSTSLRAAMAAEPDRQLVDGRARS